MCSKTVLQENFSMYVENTHGGKKRWLTFHEGMRYERKSRESCGLQRFW